MPVHAGDPKDCICPPNCYHNVSDATHCSRIGGASGCVYGASAVCPNGGEWKVTPAESSADFTGPEAPYPVTGSSTGSGAGKTTPPEITKLDNPLGGSNSTDIPTLIGRLIQGAMGIMGALVLLMFVWGGFTWLTSAGSAEKVKSGTQTIIWAAIGAAVTLSSYIILNTILSLLAGK